MAKARVAYDMGLLNGKEVRLTLPRPLPPPPRIIRPPSLTPSLPPWQFLQARAYALYAALSALDGDYLTAREYRGLLEVGREEGKEGGEGGTGLA